MMSTIMHRTQLLIEPWQYDTLKSLARQEGKSLAAVIRAILTEYLERRKEEGRKGLAGLAGIAEGPPDLGRDHDAHLYGRPRET